MTKELDALFGAASRLSPLVRKLGFSGCPITMDEFLTLRQTIASMPEASGLKRVNYPPVIVSCARCAKAGIRPACEVVKHERRGLENFYCSADCWGAETNDARFGKRLCARCGEPAPKSLGNFGSQKQGRVFCSLACKDEERQEELEQRIVERMRPCERCQAMFVPHSAATRFCSRPCAERAHSGAMLGANNPRWQNGVAAQRSAPHVTRRYRELRPHILARDGLRCVECSASENLEVHHIDENPLNNRASNLVTLCNPCHKRVHFSDAGGLMSQRLKTYAERPLSMTSRWKKPSASSRTAS